MALRMTIIIFTASSKREFLSVNGNCNILAYATSEDLNFF